MTNLAFAQRLSENTFAWFNEYYFEPIVSTSLYFSKERNYPYILRGGLSDDVELQFCNHSHQLKERVLNSKRLREIMDTCPLPISVNMKGKRYLIGKGFLAEHDHINNQMGKLLFVACSSVPTVTDMKEIKFFLCREIYEESHKVFHVVIKDILSVYTGDVTICNNLLDYMGEKIDVPKGGNVASMKRYTDSLIRATALGAFKKMKGETFVKIEGIVLEENTPAEVPGTDPW